MPHGYGYFLFYVLISHGWVKIGSGMLSRTNRVCIDLTTSLQVPILCKHQIDPCQRDEIARVEQSLINPLTIDKGTACGMEVKNHKMIVNKTYLQVMARNARVIDHDCIVMAAANAGNKLFKWYGFCTLKN